MIACCGIDCRECDAYRATVSGSERELNKVAAALSERYAAAVEAADVICDGCRTEKRRSRFCRELCRMRACCSGQGFYSCIECQDFPCRDLQSELRSHPEAIDNLKNLQPPRTRP